MGAIQGRNTSKNPCVKKEKKILVRRHLTARSPDLLEDSDATDYSDFEKGG